MRKVLSTGPKSNSGVLKGTLRTCWRSIYQPQPLHLHCTGGSRPDMDALTELSHRPVLWSSSGEHNANSEDSLPNKDNYLEDRRGKKSHGLITSRTTSQQSGDKEKCYSLREKIVTGTLSMWINEFGAEEDLINIHESSPTRHHFILFSHTPFPELPCCKATGAPF